MIRGLVVAVVCLGVAAPAHADTADDHIARARELHDRGDFVHARDELRTAYQLEPRPELLFALGQVEFNIGEYAVAIDYYQKFTATNPAPDQAALAEQAIGAARIKLAQPPPPKPPPPPHRHWDANAWGLTGLGGLAIAVASGLLYDSYRLANDRHGTLRDYDQRIGEAHATRLGGLVCGAAGMLAITAAVIRWRFHFEETVIDVHASPSGAAITLEHPL